LAGLAGAAWRGAEKRREMRAASIGRTDMLVFSFYSSLLGLFVYSTRLSFNVG